MRLLKKLMVLLLLVYLGICTLVYFKQKSMLFPGDKAQPVPANWQPTGDNTSLAIVNSSCGSISVAMWRVKQAKGTIMMTHGNGESIASINDYAYAFTNLGYNLMTWDYAGYGQSTDCWFSQDDLLADAESAYQWLATQEQPERIVIFGYSVGTSIALSVAARHQQNPVFLVAGYDSLSSVAKDSMPAYIPVNWLLRYPLNTAAWVSAIKQPIYMIHGEDDQLIRPEHAVALANKSNGKVKVEWVKHAGHTDDSLFVYRNQWLKKLLP
jgi:uncharacterized protein